MDDQSFERWSATLNEIRQKRADEIRNEVQQKGPMFSPKEFMKIVNASLDKTVTKWWEIEQESWKANKPKAGPEEEKALAEAKNELESVIDFEMDAIDRDLDGAREQVSWNDQAIKAEMTNFKAFSEELRKNFLIKVDSLLSVGKGKKKKAAAPPPNRVRRTSSGSTTQSGGGLITMFVVGLLLGGGPAIYFWDVSKQATDKHEAELAQIRSEKRVIEEQLTVIQDTFARLAKGEIRNIAQIRKKIKPVRDRFNRKKSIVEKNYVSRRENLLKTMAPGDKLDRALETLNNEKDRETQIINAKEAAQLKPLLEELQVLKEMMGE